MELYKQSSLTLTLLGSSLKNFEESHTEYSSTSTLTNEVGTQATLYEDIGFKPFMVTIYDTKGFICNFMTRLSLYKGTYTLLLTEDNGNLSINNPCRVVIHVSTNAKEWKEIRVIIQDSKKDIPVIYDVTSPTHLSIKEEIIDSYDGFYNPSLY